jgi:anti-sigma regulatory factor (Ser/Thr protein kinase)
MRRRDVRRPGGVRKRPRSGYRRVVASRQKGEDPDVRYEIGHDERAALEARRLVNELLADPDDVIGADVQLATSELVTNVVRHTTDGGELRLWDPQPDVPLRVEVEDTDTTIPALPSQVDGPGGRGLAIVDAVSEDWGVDPLPAGKIVWAEFDRDQRTSNATTDDPAGPPQRDR